MSGLFHSRMRTVARDVVVVQGGLPMHRGCGVIERRSRSVPEFDKIVLHSALDVELHADTALTADVEIDSNLHDLVEIDVHGSTLHIGAKGSFITQAKPRVILRASSVVEASVHGSGDLQLHDLLQARLRAWVRGSGDIRASGRVEHLSAQVRGSGDVRFGRVQAVRADLVVEGSGDIDVSVSESVAARVDGSGDIRVRGNPVTREQVVRGSGSIDFD